MAKFAESSNIFEEITKLIEYIPVDTTVPSNARFSPSVTIDSRFQIEKIHTLSYIFPRLSISQTSISFRDIVKIFSAYFKLALDKKLVFQRYDPLTQIGCTYPVEYLLFDYSLAALEGDYLDAKLYLAHSYHILGLRSSFNIILSVLVNNSLIHDNDVREFLLALAKAVEPRNARTYMGAYGDDYARRYNTFLTGLSELNL
jgi:hypothetical protein